MTDIWTGSVDLDNCAREPIHVPGSIQPHGALLAATQSDLSVRVASANLDDWCDTTALDAIGLPLGDVLGIDLTDPVVSGLAEPWRERFEADLDDVGLTLTVHRVDGLAVVEVERLHSAEISPTFGRDTAMTLSLADGVGEAAQAAAEAVRTVTGFDRVMVYRFDDEWNGEVIAEARTDELNTFLGLHYPATDIPAQARELYRTNWLRLIADVAYEPVLLVPAVDATTARPLDLSRSILRSISPMHVEYLSNMGVTASMSLSLIVDGRLWGLVACHHYSGAWYPSRVMRNLCEHLAQLVSLRIGELSIREATRRAADLSRVAHRLAEAISASPHWAVDDTLRAHEGDLLKVADAAGAVIVDGDERHRFGTAPGDELIDEIMAAWTDRTVPFTTDRAVGPAGAAEPNCCGALVVPFTDDDGAVLWTRSEYVRDIDWGGDPVNAKLATLEGDEVRLSPRKSFALWRETVRGRSRPWQPGEVDAAADFTRLLGGAYLRRERVNAAFAGDLQRALLPEDLPSVEGLELAAFTTPDGRGIVGGDWYDAFGLDDGLVALVVGDVAGHGLGAASTMAQMRNALRAYLVDDPSPAAALDRLDRMCRRLLPSEMATVVVGVLDTATWRLTMSSAGHPDPLLHRRGATSEVSAGRNAVIGFQWLPNHETTVELEPDDVLVVFSDGLVETRRVAYDDRVASLAALIDRAAPTSVADLPRHLVEAMTGDERADDVTVLALRRTRTADR